jgi:hypothetical protein
MSKEKDAILKRITEIRSRMDPSTLHRVEAVVQPLLDQGVFGGSNESQPHQDAATAGSKSESYDRQTALSAVKVFLESRTDGGNFKRRLAHALKSKTQ